MTIDSKQNEASAVKVASNEETRARAESTQDSTPPVGEGKAAEEKPKKKKRGFFRTFFRWFFRILLLVIIAGVIFTALALRLPQKWGWVKSPAEKAFDQTIDRRGAETLASAIEEAGLPTEGTDLFVLSLKDSDKSVVYAVLDSSQGFSFGAGGQEGSGPMIGTMMALARAQADKGLKVERVAIEYRDETGKPLAVMTAETSMILDFADQKISREEFMQAVDGRMEIRNVVERSLISF